MLNIMRKDKIWNEEIRSKTKVEEDVINKATTGIGRWATAGHVARMDTRKWTRKTTEWTPRDKRRAKGRPKQRWRDGTEQKAGDTWTQMAPNHQAWRNL